MMDNNDACYVALLDGTPVPNCDAMSLQEVADDLLEPMGERTPALIAELTREGRIDLVVTLARVGEHETIEAVDRRPFLALDAEELELVHLFVAHALSERSIMGADPYRLAKTRWLLAKLNEELVRTAGRGQ